MKFKGLISCIVVFCVFLVSCMAFNATSLAAVQRQYLGWNYFSHVLMIVLGIGMIVLHRVDFRSYGFTLKQWRFDLSVAVTCILMVLGFVPEFIFPSLAGNAPVLALFKIAAVLLALVLVAAKKNAGIDTKLRQPTTTLFSVMPFLIIGSNVLSGLGLIASTIIFQFLFVGFGEEILFRGYMQSRLNEDFGKPWQFMGVNFGPGLLISSVLFGVLHLFNPFNPFLGSYDLAVWSLVISSFGGLLFGFVKEKTGTVLSASLAHGLVDLGQVVPLLL